MTDRIDRYAQGELSPQEARTLAQEALESPDLFDELTGAALAKAALSPQTVRRARVLRIRRQAAILTVGLAAAAALLLIVLPHASSKHALNIKPELEPGSNPSQPVLLASGLRPTTASAFRGGETDSRGPQAIGSIVSFEDGSANLDLGSLDGLAKGSELQAFRGSYAVGQLQVTAVFRDRARASVTQGNHLQPKDEVRVGAVDHLNALLQQVDTAFNRGNPDTAVKLAGEAVQWGESTAVPPGAMAALWNQLAVLQMLQGQDGSAEAYLLRSASAISNTDPLYGQIQNNLGVLAELRGDRVKAAAAYSSALRPSPAEQRQTVERNLARVRGTR